MREYEQARPVGLRDPWAGVRKGRRMLHPMLLQLNGSRLALDEGLSS